MTWRRNWRPMWTAALSGWSWPIKTGCTPFALRLSDNPQDAEKIAQDTFIRAYHALKSYEAERIRTMALKPWLYQDGSEVTDG